MIHKPKGWGSKFEISFNKNLQNLYLGTREKKAESVVDKQNLLIFADNLEAMKYLLENGLEEKIDLISMIAYLKEMNRMKHTTNYQIIFI